MRIPLKYAILRQRIVLTKAQKRIPETLKGKRKMKTLIINGSPRVNGDTESLLHLVTENILGEYRTVNAYRCDISPCVDCRYCRENRGCAIQDEMQEIYGYIQECDNILIASPIYFSELTGKLLDVASRLQTYYSARHYRKENCITKPKNGAVILVGGGDGRISKPYETACTLLHHMNCYDIHEVVFSHHTDEKPAIKDGQARNGVESILRFFNGI